MGSSTSKGIGLRKPGTTEGTWSGAVVFILDEDNNPRSSGLFESNMDFVCSRDKLTLENFRTSYNEYKDLGWKPMSKQDIEKTAGIKDVIMINEL